ncbi:MAG: RusA family crossover junction endodeoxyribonuclease [Nitrospirae bacterium]|nr:RusA family crossover junction endodeoxyribonuclease [Nitrospirota bacterium]
MNLQASIKKVTTTKKDDGIDAQLVLFKATIENFVLLPKTRMTQRSLWNKRSMRYLENLKALALELKKQCPIGFYINYPVELSFSVHRPTRHRIDADNCLKSIQDALQQAKIIENDSLIQGYGKSRLWFDGKARVIVELRRL